MGGLNNSEYKSGFNEYFTILFLTLGDFNEFFESVKGENAFSQAVPSEKDMVNFPGEEIATRLSGSLLLKW
jgi:hypothetical protein